METSTLEQCQTILANAEEVLKTNASRGSRKHLAGFLDACALMLESQVTGAAAEGTAVVSLSLRVWLLACWEALLVTLPPAMEMVRTIYLRQLDRAQPLPVCPPPPPAGKQHPCAVRIDAIMRLLWEAQRYFEDLQTTLRHAAAELNAVVDFAQQLKQCLSQAPTNPDTPLLQKCMEAEGAVDGRLQTLEDRLKLLLSPYLHAAWLQVAHLANLEPFESLPDVEGCQPGSLLHNLHSIAHIMWLLGVQDRGLQRLHKSGAFVVVHTAKMYATGQCEHSSKALTEASALLLRRLRTLQLIRSITS